MFISRRSLLVGGSGVFVASVVARAAVRVGTVAPDFAATDSNGEVVRLADLKGRVVVLEWTNDA